MAAPQALSSFSLSHAAILDGSTPAELADVYGVNEGSLEFESDSYDRTGDDKILSTQRWLTKGTVSLSSNYIPIPLLETLYGIEAEDGEGDHDFTLQLATERSMNQPPRPLVVEAPGVTENDEPFTLRIVLYKVKFGPMSFDQFMSYKEGLAVSFEGDALLSDEDELGEPFTDGQGARIGKIVGVSLT